ncbi:hypothetical protein PITCH_A1520002 [uncultured Desulfobacterium sp.]|uniref:Uncharacterized protein n=1 Tax=uncultured Desulfobacterium sp. TaxID=201089 RepID=A0A445MT86_9BACT|nr:hypothetical protein PITCH_A1520002 [uncultured Desulfobacterium sp.]
MPLEDMALPIEQIVWKEYDEFITSLIT